MYIQPQTGADIHAVLKNSEFKRVQDYKFVPDTTYFLDKLISREQGRLSSNTYFEEYQVKKKMTPIIKQFNNTAGQNKQKYFLVPEV